MSSVRDVEVVCVCLVLGLFPESDWKEERSSTVKYHVLNERSGDSSFELSPRPCQRS
jgi:hypothetical protein